MNIRRIKQLMLGMVLISSISVYGEDASALYQKGLQSLSQVKLKEAEKFFGRAIYVDGEYLQAYLALASLYNNSQRYQDGISLLNKANQLFPNSADVWSLKGQIFYRMGQIDQALQAHETAITLSPDRIDLLERAAQFYAQQGDTVRSDSLTQQRDTIRDSVVGVTQ